MTTPGTPRTLTTYSRSGALALAGALVLLVSLTMSFFATPAAAAVLTTHDNVTICHAIGGPKNFVVNHPNVDSIVKGTGHGGHADDVIPSFQYDLGAGVKTYPGNNLALVGILNNGCAPSSVQAVAPTVVQSQCVNGAGTVPTYTIVPVTGVVYSVGGTPVSGTVNGVAGGTLNVVATAASAAYTLTGPTTFPVNFAATPTPCGGVGVGGVGGVGVVPVVGGPTAAPGAPAPDGNLGVSKTGTATAQPGDELVWSIVVTNTSGVVATGFSVSDTLAKGLSFSQAQGTDFVCSVAGPSITCTYSGSLAPGATATISVRALLDEKFRSDAVSNSAVLVPNRPDTDSADNTSTATTAVILPEPAEPAEFTGGGGGGAVSAPENRGSGAALPFTGSHAPQLLSLGLLLLLSGSLMTVAGTRTD